MIKRRVIIRLSLWAALVLLLMTGCASSGDSLTVGQDNPPHQQGAHPD